jgi:hypothetical protein
MYNLLSDKLDRFEREIRKARNKVFAAIMSGVLSLTLFCFKFSRPYIHTELLKQLKDRVALIHAGFEEEMELRKKISATTPSKAGGAGAPSSQSDINQIIRDSSVLSGDALRDFKERQQSAASFRVKGGDRSRIV